MNMLATRDCTLKSLNSYTNSTQVKVSENLTFTRVQYNVKAS